MRTGSARWLAAFLALFGCATGFLTFQFRDESVVTADLNRDGQVDVWQLHDDRGRLVAVIRDSNFDGLPDVREYYERGLLVRRESDRNFNNQIDLIEDFDAATGQRVRSVVDLDDDGTADVLLLFQGPRVVFVKHASRNGTAADGPRRDAHGVATPLRPLDDPFLGDASIRSDCTPAAPPSVVARSIVGGLPTPSRTVVCVLVPASKVSGGPLGLIGTAKFAAGSPRGPPFSPAPNQL